MEGPPTRRPIRVRETQWAAAVARRLARVGLRPNHISLLSVLFGALAGAAFVAAGRMESPSWRAAAFLAAAVAMPLRLLCNLFDGMVAVEGGFRTKSGEIYNEFPDRVSDVCIFAGAGYASPGLPWTVELGWGAAVLSVTTAYVRALGASAGAGQHFLGPMAKPQRMAVMIVASVASAVTEAFAVRGVVMAGALVVVGLGCLVTIARRCVRIVRTLESREC